VKVSAMPRKVAQVVIDERGDVHLEFSGYEGQACRIDEEKLRQGLAELGLRAQIDQLRLKDLQEIAAEIAPEQVGSLKAKSKGVMGR